MRNNFRAYTDFSYTNLGCCLICENAEPGCLCYDCKCKKCSYYLKRGEDFSGDSVGEVYISYEKEGICEIANDEKGRYRREREAREEEEREIKDKNKVFQIRLDTWQVSRR